MLENSLIPFTDSCKGDDIHPIVDKLVSVCDDLASPRIVLKPLIPRLFRLKIQATARVSDWLTEVFYSEAEKSLPIALSAMTSHRKLLERFDKIFGSCSLTEYIDKTKADEIVQRLEGALVGKTAGMDARLEQVIITSVCNGVSQLSINTREELNLARAFECLLTSNVKVSESSLKEAWTEMKNKFVDHVRHISTQSKKIIANYKRLRSILKDQESAESTEDKEAQMKALSKIIQQESNSIERTVKCS